MHARATRKRRLSLTRSLIVRRSSLRRHPACSYYYSCCCCRCCLPCCPFLLPPLQLGNLCLLIVRPRLLTCTYILPAYILALRHLSALYSYIHSLRSRLFHASHLTPKPLCLSLSLPSVSLPPSLPPSPLSFWGVFASRIPSGSAPAFSSGSCNNQLPRASAAVRAAACLPAHSISPTARPRPYNPTRQGLTTSLIGVHSRASLHTSPRHSHATALPPLRVPDDNLYRALQ